MRTHKIAFACSKWEKKVVCLIVAAISSTTIINCIGTKPAQVGLQGASTVIALHKFLKSYYAFSVKQNIEGFRLVVALCFHVQDEHNRNMHCKICTTYLLTQQV